MLAVEDLALVHDLGAIDRVRQQVEQAATLERDPTLVRSAGGLLDLGPDLLRLQLSDQLDGGSWRNQTPILVAVNVRLWSRAATAHLQTEQKLTSTRRLKAAIQQPTPLLTFSPSADKGLRRQVMWLHWISCPITYEELADIRHACAKTERQPKNAPRDALAERTQVQKIRMLPRPSSKPIAAERAIIAAARLLLLRPFGALSGRRPSGTCAPLANG